MPGRLENYKTANLAGAKRQCGSIGGNIVEDDLRVARVRGWLFLGGHYKDFGSSVKQTHEGVGNKVRSRKNGVRLLQYAS